MPVTPQATFCATLVDEWARAGVTDAVVAPGSRSTPLALALAADSRVAVHVFHDERAAGFCALGFGAATGRPAIVLTTSGTAATHLHAAVVEAGLAGVPLIACTADRPPELRDVGAPQTIDQTHLYGRAVRWFHDPGVPDAATASTWRSVAARSVAEAVGPPAGAVHLNLPFRDPLVGDAAPLPPGREGGEPWARRVAPSAAPIVVSGERVLVVAGAGAHPSLGACGWPVIADARSGLEGPSVVRHADAMLRHAPTAARLRPDVVVRVGPAPASRVVNEWLAATDAREIVVASQWRDPTHTAAVIGMGSLVLPEANVAWTAAWQRASEVATAAVDNVLRAERQPTEPHVAREVLATMAADTNLVAASSMPVRDVEWYARPRRDVRVFANRGANGIDGTLSTAIGVALATRRPTVVLLGDVAFLHDSSALIGLRARGVDLAIVVIDNDGGGIFSFLPQATATDASTFEQLFGTPHGVKPEELAAAHGITSLTVGDPSAVGPSLRSTMDVGGVWLVVARTERADNVRVHDAINAAVARALAESENVSGSNEG
jgi:2-succinyl-5-enolpyruvyl-6-hydroxy-3-cyclohexene-1-carboxylate synthase